MDGGQKGAEVRGEQRVLETHKEPRVLRLGSLKEGEKWEEVRKERGEQSGKSEWWRAGVQRGKDRRGTGEEEDETSGDVMQKKVKN